MPTVYRVECPQCRSGPYSCLCRPTMADTEQSLRRAINEGYRPSRHPLPEDDGLMIHQWRACTLFGFASRKQALDWFRTDAEHRVFAQAGFRVLEYDIADDDLLVGRHQVVFDGDRATQIAAHDPITFFSASQTHEEVA